MVGINFSAVLHINNTRIAYTDVALSFFIEGDK